MNIALLGFGVVGSGVYEWCRDREDLHVRRVLVRSEKPQIADIATHDFEDILHDDSIDIVAEVMGGLHPAYEYVTAALKAGKHVVTANKALIAAYYQELTELAKAQGKALLCTAAVGGRHSVAGESGPVQEAGHHLPGGRHHERHQQFHHGRHAQVPCFLPRHSQAGAGAGLCRGRSQRRH